MKLGKYLGFLKHKQTGIRLFFILSFLTFPSNAEAEWVKDKKQRHTHQTHYSNLTDITKRDGWIYFLTLIEIHDGYKKKNKTYFSSTGYAKVNCDTGEYKSLVWILHTLPMAKGNSIEINASNETVLTEDILKTHPICSKF